MFIEVKEFCCGFSLRTGTLILLWTVLVIDSFLLWMYLNDLIYSKLPDYYILTAFLDRNVRIHHFIGYTMGVVSSLIGIISIAKNMPKYLICSFIYFCYYVLYYVLGMTILIIFPTSYQSIIWGHTAGLNTAPDYVPVIPNTFAYLFFIGFMSYFAVVVRSCRNAMLRDNSINDDIEVPNPAANRLTWL